jgi:uncharacterized protein YqgV (UPF0045/DUF77 family)
MIFTIEISHYPLINDYEEDIISFIQQLHEIPNIIVRTNAMSTQVKGEHFIILPAIGEIISKLGGKTSSTILKIIPRDLPIEKREVTV